MGVLGVGGFGCLGIGFLVYNLCGKSIYDTILTCVKNKIDVLSHNHTPTQTHQPKHTSTLSMAPVKHTQSPRPKYTIWRQRTPTRAEKWNYLSRMISCQALIILISMILCWFKGFFVSVLTLLLGTVFLLFVSPFIEYVMWRRHLESVTVGKKEWIQWGGIKHSHSMTAD